MDDHEIRHLFESCIERAKSEGIPIIFSDYAPRDVQMGGRSVVPKIVLPNGTWIPDPNVVTALKDLVEKEVDSPDSRLELRSADPSSQLMRWPYYYHPAAQ